MSSPESNSSNKLESPSAKEVVGGPKSPILKEAAHLMDESDPTVSETKTDHNQDIGGGYIPNSGDHGNSRSPDIS